MKVMLIEPVVTEKSLALAAQNRYQFYVPLRASKNEIKDSIARIFGVTVKTLTTSRQPTRRTRFRQRFGQTRGRKKATVTLTDSQTLVGFAPATEMSRTTETPQPVSERPTVSTVSVRSRSRRSA